MDGALPHQPDHARPRLLVCAYAFSPVLGSEFAQGWNYVREMAGRYRLTVLVGSTDGRMGDFANLSHPEVLALGADVAIVPVAPDWFCRLIKYLDVRIGLTWLFVFGLRRWHRLALGKARALHAAVPFAAVHQLGPVGFRNPGQLYRLGVPAYWGPLGGFQFVNLAMAWRSDRKYGALCLIRNVSTWLAARSATVRQAMRRFDRLSFATETNRANTARLTGRSGPVLSDQAITSTGDQPLPDKGAARMQLYCDTESGFRVMFMPHRNLMPEGSARLVLTIDDAKPLNLDGDAFGDDSTDVVTVHNTGRIQRARSTARHVAVHYLGIRGGSGDDTFTFGDLSAERATLMKICPVK